MNKNRQSNNRRILVIDDNTAIHDDIKKILCNRVAQKEELDAAKALLFGDVAKASSQDDFEIEVAFQGEEGLRKVVTAQNEGRPFALAFVDVRMPPGWDGVETIKRIWESDPDLQFVICTAYSDYSWEDMVRRVGRSASMVVLKKPFDNIEVLQLAHALTEKWSLTRQVRQRLQSLDQLVDQRTVELRAANGQLKQEIGERLQAQQALGRSEERFSKAFRANPIPLTIQSMKDGAIYDANVGFETLTGFVRDELVGRTPVDVGLYPDLVRLRDIFARMLGGSSLRDVACQIKTRSGATCDILLSTGLIELAGEPCFLAIWHDVTEKILLEQQLRHSLKMQAIGQLSAGIAHDFNNLLTVIQGNASLMLSDMAGSPDEEVVQGILTASQRAAKLVRQLLTFSHKQRMEVTCVNVRELLKSISEMLPRILGEDIAVAFDIPADLPAIRVDAGMIEQLIMNLSVNSRDAMPRGGRIEIRAEAIEIMPQEARLNHEARPGRFLCLSVSDTGCGIPPEVLPRIFDPFFTTKPVDKGTGLGLATVYGIVKQHGGWINVETEVSKGSCFRCFFPFDERGAATGEAAPAQGHVGAGAVSGGAAPGDRGRETVLVVEDEEIVRRFVTRTLESRGYKVIGAPNGVEALKVWEDRSGEIDLLLTDQVMPAGISGVDLARRLSATKPALKVILTSGYNRDLDGGDDSLPPGHQFVAKPYEVVALLQAVRSSLDMN